MARIDMRKAVLVAAIAACGKGAPAPSAGSNAGSNAGSAAAAKPAAKPAVAIDAGAPGPDAGPPTLKSQSIDAKDLPAGVKPKGVLEDAYTFLDAHGANYVLFSSRASGAAGDRSRYLVVDVWLVAPGAAPRQLSAIRDLVEHCAGEPVAAFHDLLDIGDVDHDGVAEVTFGYEVGCRTAPSPVPFKLLMLEDGVKYALRGTTRVPPGGTAPGGDVTADPAFDKAPAGFLDHAKALWAKNVDDQMLEPAPTTDDSVPDADAGAPAGAPPIPRIATDDAPDSLPRGVHHSGDLDSALRFDDAAGANYVLFSSKLKCGVDTGRAFEKRTVWVDQYVVPPGGAPQQVASWTDTAECPAATLDLDTDHFAVLDTDYDGIGEVVIAQSRVCYGSDGVDPPTASLIVLGDPPLRLDGMALWGNDPDQKPDTTVEPDVDHWTPALLAYARAVWPSIARIPISTDESAISSSPCRR